MYILNSYSNFKHKLMGPNQSKKKVSMKTTLNIMTSSTFGRRPLMEDDLKIWKFQYLSSHWSDLAQILNISTWDHTKVKKGFNEDNLQWKTTSNGRWPQNMKIWISQQSLIGSFSNPKYKLIGPNQRQKIFQWRQPLMKDDL